MNQKQESLNQQESSKKKERIAKAFANVNQTPRVKENQNTFGASLGCFGNLPDYRAEFKPISIDQIASMSNMDSEISYKVGSNKQLWPNNNDAPITQTAKLLRQVCPDRL